MGILIVKLCELAIHGAKPMGNTPLYATWRIVNQNDKLHKTGKIYKKTEKEPR